MARQANQERLQNIYQTVQIHPGECPAAVAQRLGLNRSEISFRYGRYLFMHNGDVGNFRRVRRRMLEAVCDEAFSNVYGSTDSEHFFALCIDELLSQPTTQAPRERLAQALQHAIARTVALVAEHGDGEPSWLNCALSDGEHAVVSRFTSAGDDSPESLYYFHGALYPAIAAATREAHDDAHGRHPVIVSSERLTEDAGWQPIPVNYLMLVSRGRVPELRAIAS